LIVRAENKTSIILFYYISRQA